MATTYPRAAQAIADSQLSELVQVNREVTALYGRTVFQPNDDAILTIVRRAGYTKATFDSDVFAQAVESVEDRIDLFNMQ